MLLTGTLITGVNQFSLMKGAGGGGGGQQVNLCIKITCVIIRTTSCDVNIKCTHCNTLNLEVELWNRDNQTTTCRHYIYRIVYVKGEQSSRGFFSYLYIGRCCTLYMATVIKLFIAVRQVQITSLVKEYTIN